MRLSLLGGFELERDGARIKLPTRKTESLLAFLALHPGMHDRGHLATLFWGESTDSDARRSLRVALSSIRKALGAGLQIDGPAAGWHPGIAIRIDTFEFEAALAPFMTGPLAGEGSGPAMASALALYRGELLAGYADAWIAPERDRLRAVFVAGLLRHVAHLRDQGAYSEAIEAGARLLQADPANEAGHQQLILCHLARGDQPAAQAQYERCRAALQQAFGVEPAADTRNLLAPEPRRASAAAIPQPRTPLIGRERELDTVGRLMANERMITLVGAGGSGKTRLAIALARELAGTFEHGAGWVDLAPLSDPNLTAQAAAQALGLGSREATLPNLTGFLNERQFLVVLDNCEHVLAAAAAVARAVLAACPRVAVLATSREALGVPGEIAWRVPTLGVPASDEGAASPATALAYPGIRLFVERAKTANREFSLTAANATDVAAICRQLDGIPLAIELAAARMRALAPGQIAERLDRRFDLLTGGSRGALPRQQTLRALVDWSYDLLEDEERALFRRLGVFAGGFTLEAAERVCGQKPLAPERVEPALARLADKSLVIAPDNGQFRYTMLETLRAYAAEQLHAADGDDSPSRHARYFAGLAQQGGQALSDGHDTTAWLERIETDLDNIRAATVWALASGEKETALALISGMPSFWSTRGHFAEGRSWLDQAAALTFENPTREIEVLRAEVLSLAGYYAFRQHDNARAETMYARALALERALDNQRGVAMVLGQLGLLAHTRHAFGLARAYYEEALAIRRALNLPASIAVSLNYLGLVAQYQQDYPRAEAFYAEALAIRRGLSDLRGEAVILINLGDVAMYRGDVTASRTLHEQALSTSAGLKHKQAMAIVLNRLALHDLRDGDAGRARQRCRESFALFAELEDQRGLAEVLERLAVIAAAERDWPRVARLAGLTNATRAAINVPIPPPERAGMDEALRGARAALPPASFDALWREGQLAPLGAFPG